MQTWHYSMQSWYDQTTLHPIGLIAVLLLGIGMLVVPRRYALIPMLIMACFISPAQRIVIATLDFNLIRLMIIFGWCRVFIYGEVRGFKWKGLDSAVVMWTVIATVVVALREGTIPALIYRLGLTYDAIGMYFLFRMLIRSWKDLEWLMIAAAVISVPIAVVFLIEQFTGRNMFAVLGGVPEVTTIRDGKLRCRGPFPHPILAGCFWAAMIPLIGALWWHSRRIRWLAPIGIVASLIVINATASDSPISAVLAAIVAAALFPLRGYMRWIQWAIVACAISLQIVMTNPIWHLMTRVRFNHGSTGWYRYKMIDGFVESFDLWWLMGTRSYIDIWSHGFDAITNQYVLEGLEGGLITFILFLAMIFLGFRGAGLIQKYSSKTRFHKITAWMVGASIFVHCVSFLAVSYFGQIVMIWYMVLAISASLSPSSSRLQILKSRYRERRISRASSRSVVPQSDEYVIGEPGLAMKSGPTLST